jgi:site-specific recombinase XerD
MAYLRHAAASWLRMSDADIETVAQLLGHKDLRKRPARFTKVASSVMCSHTPAAAAFDNPT